MKKLLTALILSTLVLSGCGIFRSQHAWKQAKQENPLQVPPGLDRPSTSAALTIPPPNESASSSSASAAPASTHRSQANATEMHLPGSVDAAYKRVGLVLQQGGLGTVTAQDPAQHTYQLSVDTKPTLGASKSFMQKHFSNLQQQDKQGERDSTSSQGAASVQLKVAPASSGDGSTVSASGDPQQAVHVISVLSSRLGG